MSRLTVSRALTPSFSVVDSDAERQWYKQRLLSLWIRRNQRDHFPGCNPCSISRTALDMLGKDPYMISLKSDGVRYALLLTTRSDTQHSPVAMMIDRSWNMYEIEVVAPEEYFTLGTILEGEMVWQQPEEKQMIYLVFDAIVVKGVRLTNQPFETRIAEATRCTRLSSELATLPAEDLEDRCVETDSIAVVHYYPPIAMRPKCFVACPYASRLWAERQDSDHRVDGMILNRCKSLYTPGTAHSGSILKWKDHSTIDLRGFDHDLQMIDAKLPDDMYDRKVVILQSRVVANVEDDIREFLITINANEIHLFPIRCRPDKMHPNSERVVTATVADVLDGITIDELSHASESASPTLT